MRARYSSYPGYFEREIDSVKAVDPMKSSVSSIARSAAFHRWKGHCCTPSGLGSPR